MKLMKLTHHQTITANKILFEVYGALEGTRKNKFVSLTGPAGVGKTTVTQELIHILSKKYTIKATAPTHKATKVLAKSLPVSSSTIHSFLKLKLKPDFDTGLMSLVEDWIDAKDKSKKESVDILIIDESSQISLEMLNHIQKGIDRKLMKVVLFVGDSKQLKPVEYSEHSVYAYVKSHELTKVVRQAQGNPIIRESTKIREIIDTQQFVALDKLIFEESNKITLYTDHQVFLDDYIKDDSDKIIASYTNEAVDAYNFYTRKCIKGDVPYIVVGDELIFQDSLTKGKDKLIYNNNDIVVVSHAYKKHQDALGIDYWDISVENNEPFRIVDYDSLTKWNEYLAKLKKEANDTKDKYEKKRLWSFYFQEVQKYGNVKYTYASTLHKLQGSTYETMYFDFRSLKKFQYDMDTVYRLIYVAITRASDSVKILI